jgi:hypothetical protein
VRTAIPSPLLTLILSAVVLLVAGCPSNPVEPGHSPLVVNAERTVEVSFEAVTAFLSAENDNRVLVARDFPAIHAFAEQTRRDGPKAFAEANAAVRAYKVSRTTGDGDVMNAKLARVQSLARLAREYLVRIQTR